MATKSPVTITMPPVLTARLDRLAEAEGSCRSALVRKAVIRLLNEIDPLPSPAIMPRRAKQNPAISV